MVLPIMLNPVEFKFVMAKYFFVLANLVIWISLLLCNLDFINFLFYFQKPQLSLYFIFFGFSAYFMFYVRDNPGV